MSNPLRAWVRLTVRSLPKKAWRDDPKKTAEVAVARITGTLVVLTITAAYYCLDAMFPALKNLWRLSFLLLTMVLYALVWARIHRVVRYHVRQREKDGNTRP